jgi:hypothetical protein
VAIASRVSRPKPDAGVNLSEITLNEATIMQVRSNIAFPSLLRLSIPRARCLSRAKLISELGAPNRIQAFSTVRDKIGRQILS